MKIKCTSLNVLEKDLTVTCDAWPGELTVFSGDERRLFQQSPLYLNQETAYTNLIAHVKALAKLVYTGEVTNERDFGLFRNENSTSTEEGPIYLTNEYAVITIPFGKTNKKQRSDRMLTTKTLLLCFEFTEKDKMDHNMLRDLSEKLYSDYKETSGSFGNYFSLIYELPDILKQQSGSLMEQFLFCGIYETKEQPDGSCIGYIRSYVYFTTQVDFLKEMLSNGRIADSMKDDFIERVFQKYFGTTQGLSELSWVFRQFATLQDHSLTKAKEKIVNGLNNIHWQNAVEKSFALTWFSSNRRSPDTFLNPNFLILESIKKGWDREISYVLPSGTVVEL